MDITERKQTEEALRAAWADLGRVAGAAGHAGRTCRIAGAWNVFHFIIPLAPEA
jgi:hypothetical protein